MRHANTLKVTLALALAMGFCSNGAASGMGDKSAPKPGSTADFGRPRPVPQPAVVVGPAFGGAGGDPTYHSCRHPYGIQVNAGVTGVLRLGLRCEDGTGTTYWDLPVVGKSTGMLSGMDCPPGFEISGFQGRSGVLVDAIGIICRKIDPMVRIWQDTSLIYGGTGGADFTWECPQSYHVGGVWLRSGSQVDALQVICEHD